MKVTSKILILMLILVFAGCANMSEQKKSCILKSSIAGAVFGGGAGAAAGKPGGTINRGEGAGIGAASGAIIGGLLGLAFCEEEVDSDGDGVPDHLDKCPNTPPGCPVDENGCSPDADGDGVKDCIDKCPNTPKGCKVDKNGCPQDTDGDGVPDCIDKCKGTPKGETVDKNGCPPVGEELMILTGINFAFDSSKLDQASKEIVNRAVANLKRNPKMQVLIEGHTDSTGPEDYNMGLSIRRAQAVKDYIVSQGIAKERMSIKGFGETQPLVTNDTKEGRAQNRRVEFVVTVK